MPRTLRGDIWLSRGQRPVSLAGFSHGGARSYTKQLVPRQHHLQEFPGCWRPCIKAFFPSGRPCCGDKTKGCTVWVQDMEMQPLVLQESINLCDAQRKSYLILEFMSMSFLPATPVRQEQVVWWAYTAGGTVATLHVTRTAITEEHMNRLNMCIRNTHVTSIRLVQFSQSCLLLCKPMDCSTPGFPVHHQLPELSQTHVHWFGNAIQPTHPLSSPSPPDFNHSQHQGLFQWVSSSCQVDRILELQLQHQSFQWIFRIDFL